MLRITIVVTGFILPQVAIGIGVECAYLGSSLCAVL